MAIRVVRLGSPRAPAEGLRLGTVRRPPRGVPKADWARRDFFDVWVPDLSPSPQLVAQALNHPESEREWAKFVRAYRREMREPGPRRLLELIAALSHSTDLSVGCYC